MKLRRRKGREEDEEEPVDTRTFYEILRVSRDFTRKELDRAFLKGVNKYGKGSWRFKRNADKSMVEYNKIWEAYKVLGDLHLKLLYDGDIKDINSGDVTLMKMIKRDSRKLIIKIEDLFPDDQTKSFIIYPVAVTWTLRNLQYAF